LFNQAVVKESLVYIDEAHRPRRFLLFSLSLSFSVILTDAPFVSDSLPPRPVPSHLRFSAGATRLLPGRRSSRCENCHSVSVKNLDPAEKVVLLSSLMSMEETRPAHFPM
jgi:hypothetical protein